MVTRSGRGDRLGRYGNTTNDHNFRDMDYRGYGQDDEEMGAGYDVRADADRQYGHDELPLGVHDFSPGLVQDHLGFHQRREIVCEGKGLSWPPRSQSQSDPALPTLPREDEGSRWEFEQLRTGPQERGRGKGVRDYPENSAPQLGGREDNWGRGGVHSEQREYGTARQRDEDRFPQAPGKRRVRRSICL